MNEEQNNTPKAPDIPMEEMKMPENSTVVQASDDEKRIPGPVILVIGLALLAILIGLFLWFSNVTNTPNVEPQPAPVERPTPEQNNEPESTTAEAQTDVLEVVSSSDELSAIEADLESTDIDSLDIDLQAIEVEIEGSIE